MKIVADKLLLKSYNGYINFFIHKTLANLICDLSINYGFVKSAASSTYCYKYMGKTEGVYFSFKITDNHLNINIDKLELFDGKHENRNYLLNFNYNYIIHNRENVDNGEFCIEGNDNDNAVVLKMKNQIKKDIFSYIKTNIPELNSKFRKQKIQEFLKDNEN